MMQQGITSRVLNGLKDGTVPEHLLKIGGQGAGVKVRSGARLELAADSRYK